MPTREETAEMLAQEQYEVDEDVRSVYRLLSDTEQDAGEPIKLMVVDASVERWAEYTRVMPLFFKAHPASGLFYPYSVAVVSPTEVPRIAAGELPLPEGWRLGAEIPNAVPMTKVAA